MLGDLIRDRRLDRGLSLRALAREAGCSPSYLGAIELGRNPATGRAPEPSLRILAALGRVLDLDLAALATAGAPPVAHAAHALLYVMRSGPVDVLDHVARLHAATTERWVYVPDPREPPAGDDRVALHCRWPLGADPYPDRLLEPGRVLGALERELRAGGRLGPGLGLAIADCSAVMRWVSNPEAEIAFEAHWADDAAGVFRSALGEAPTANVCVYHHDDIEALAPAVDPLGVALTLLREHTAVAVVRADGRVDTGAAAVRTLLQSARPAGIATEIWAELCGLVAQGLAAHIIP